MLPIASVVVLQLPLHTRPSKGCLHLRQGLSLTCNEQDAWMWYQEAPQPGWMLTGGVVSSAYPPPAPLVPLTNASDHKPAPGLFQRNLSCWRWFSSMLDITSHLPITSHLTRTVIRDEIPPFTHALISSGRRGNPEGGNHASF